MALLALALVACSDATPYSRDAGDTEERDAAGGDAASGHDAGVDGGSDGSFQRDLWVWRWPVATDPAQRDEIFAFVAGRGVRTLYVEGEYLVEMDSAALVGFVTEARARGLEVDVLFGNPEWARRAMHGRLLDLVRATVAIAAGAGTDGPRGIHLDVEPYVLPEWDPDPEPLALEHLELLRAVAAELSGVDLELAVDIPFWFDGVTVDDGGGPRPLSEPIIELADRVVILAYRDHAAPPDGIVDLASGELAFAATVDTPVVVGVETTCGLDPEKVTFCEEGSATLEAELASAHAMLGALPAFDGFAVHSWVSWRDLP